MNTVDPASLPDPGEAPASSTTHQEAVERRRQRRLIAGRLTGPGLTLLGTLVVGTAGYMLIEGWSVNDAFYMVATTVTTVGFGEVHPLSTAGRLFTVGLIAAGVVLIWYTMTLLVSTIVESSVRQRWERRHMDQQIRRMTGHTIVCGYGRVGHQAVEELRRDGQAIVIVEADPATLAGAEAEGLLIVVGDATEDAILQRAGIDRAAALISTVASDAGNIFVALSARALRPDLSIVARADNDDAVPKLRRAGANQVVSPYAIGGRQMAQLAVRPSAVNFVETLMRGVDGELLLEDIQIETGAAVVGRTVAQVRQDYGTVMVLAVQRDGRSLLPPPSDLVLRPGDVVAVAGRERDLEPLEKACATPTAGAG